MSKRRGIRTIETGGLSKLVTKVKPRRDYWGNIYDEDTFDENANIMATENYDYSDFDSEDDHDSYYEMLE